MGTFKNSGEHQYQTLRCNVDMLKLIQLGLTFCDENGNLPTVPTSPPHLPCLNNDAASSPQQASGRLAKLIARRERRSRRPRS